MRNVWWIKSIQNPKNNYINEPVLPWNLIGSPGKMDKNSSHRKESVTSTTTVYWRESRSVVYNCDRLSKLVEVKQ
jgi:hypothetical protein